MEFVKIPNTEDVDISMLNASDLTLVPSKASAEDAEVDEDDDGDFYPPENTGKLIRTKRK